MVCKPSFSIILMLNYPPIGKQKSANWINGENPPAGKKPANTDYSTNCRKGGNKSVKCLYVPHTDCRRV